MSPTLWAIVLAVLGAALVLATAQGTAASALAGLAVAALAILGLGPGTLLPLAVFVLGAGGLTRLGRGAKERAGAAEPHRGRRGVAHVVAKLGVAALLGAAGFALGADGATGELLRVAFAASLCAAFADTAATESGPLARGRAAILWPPRLVPHGTIGAMSLVGTGAAAAAALTTAAAAVLSGSIPPASWPFAAIAGWGAAMFESVLARTPLGLLLGHHGRNAMVSLLGAAGAAWAWGVARS